MTRTIFIKKYARALFQLADEQQQTDGILKEFQAFVHLLTAEAEINAVLSIANTRQRDELVKTLFESRMSALFYHFLRLILKNRRQHLLPGILNEYQVLHDLRHQRVRAVVTTAHPLLAQQLQELNSRLSRQLQAEIFIENKIDREILGGMIIRVDGKIYNASILDQIKQLRNYLVENPA